MISQPRDRISELPSAHDYFPLNPICICTVLLLHCITSLTFLRGVGGSVSGQSSKHLPFILSTQPGPQEQDRVQLSARHDVCR